MPNFNNVIIFREKLLLPSETFIKSQAMALKRYHPVFVGLKTVDGLALPKNNTLLLNPGNSIGRMNELFFKSFLLPPKHFIKQLSELKPALIHAHFAPDAIYALPIANAIDVPLLVTFHGYDVTVQDKDWYLSKGFSSKLYPIRRQTLINSNAHYIAVSEFIKERAIAQGYPEKRIQTHHIGVDTDQFAVNHEIPCRPLVLFVGRLVEKKGCSYLISAMGKVQDIHADAELIIIGDGPLRNELEQQAAKLLRRYTFLGVQEPAVVRQWMQSARVVAIPSITAESGDSEGLPITVYEAMASGRPVVSSLTAGIPEAVVHNETGFLAKEKDVDELAAYLTQLLVDNELWNNFSISSAKRCYTFFSLKKQTELLEEIYDSIIF